MLWQIKNNGQLFNGKTNKYLSLTFIILITIMAQNKTIETNESVDAFLATVTDEKKRTDCEAIIKLIAKHTKLKPKMWGNAIIGFGTYHYKYESGREGDAPLTALSPRASSIVVYMGGAKEQTGLLAQLGKHKLSGGCIHIKKFEDIDTNVLKQLIDISIKYYKDLYPA